MRHGETKLTNMKIKTLLPSLFGLLVVLGVAQGAIALNSISNLKDATEGVNYRLARSEVLSQINMLFGDVRRAYVQGMSAGTIEEVDAAIAAIHKAQADRKKAADEFGATITSPALVEKFAIAEKSVTEYEAAGAAFIEYINNGQLYEAKGYIQQTLTPKGQEAVAKMNDILDLNSSLGREAAAGAQKTASFANTVTILSIIVSTLIAIAAAVLSHIRISRPITEITDAMNKLAAGDNASAIPHSGRKDEIGDMSAAVTVFRQNAIERERLEHETEANRNLSEKERLSREEQKAREAAEVLFAVDNLGTALDRLAAGDMVYRIEEKFAGQLDQLRTSFNTSIAKLHGVLSSIGDNARMIDAGANEIRSAAEDLSKRTEQQAASVEETAAALEQVTTAVKDSAVRASEAGELVSQTRLGAEQSGQVVRKAVVAMQGIESSSNEISNIIGVIDDIAFQTNLLALNAGVEAARAGEAGKGFAVVAQEVRELAQRSAKAAKEIKALITTSSEQVRQGVELVGETGRTLESIVAEVQEINRHVHSIVTSAKEQSTGLSEINTSVNQMDQGTQQNAAMVEQSTAASNSLATQAAALTSLLSQFKLDNGNSYGIATANEYSTPVQSPARALGQKLASSLGRKFG